MQKFDHVGFWRDPSAATPEQQQVYGKQYKYSLPEFYLDKKGFSGPIMTTVEKYAQKNWSILEIGSGTGRNLYHLWNAGYRNLCGIEINQKAIDLGKKHFPEIAGVPVACGDIADLIRDIEPVDLIFSRGCFMHIPYEYDWVWEVIAEKAQKLIMTSDDEENIVQLPSRIKRNYKDTFEPLGWKCVETQTCEIYKPLPPTTIKRVFLKEEKQDAPVEKPKAAPRKKAKAGAKKKDSEQMKIAVLVPTIHRPKGLRRSLQSLKNTAPNVTPVVAAETDDYQAQNLAKEFGAIFTHVSEPLAGGAKAWNDALRAAPNFDAYFTGSDDIEFYPGWLEEVLRVLKEELDGSGLVGTNDGRWDRAKVMKMCATHYLMTRDFIVEHMGGVAAQPFYFCDWTDMEANIRARRAGKWAWAENALTKHLWNGPHGDAGYQRASTARPQVRKIYHDREARGFPDDFEPILTE